MLVLRAKYKKQLKDEGTPHELYYSSWTVVGLLYLFKWITLVHLTGWLVQDHAKDSAIGTASFTGYLSYNYLYGCLYNES